jgi:glutathione S-transferase
MLRLWGRRNSINVQKVLWCAAEIGLDYERIDAGMEHGVTKTPEYLAKNPNSLVPTLEEGEYILWESNVIVRYLSAKYSEGSLCPSDLQQRAHAEQWMDWQATTLWATARLVFWGLVRTPPEKRDQAQIDKAIVDSERALAMLDSWLEKRDYVAAGRLTMGDIPIGASAYRWFAMGMERSKFPNVARWYDRLTEREGFQKHIMLPLS